MVPRSPPPSKLTAFFQPQIKTVFKFLLLFIVRILDLVFAQCFCSPKALALAIVEVEIEQLLPLLVILQREEVSEKRITSLPSNQWLSLLFLVMKFLTHCYTKSVHDCTASCCVGQRVSPNDIWDLVEFVDFLKTMHCVFIMEFRFIYTRILKGLLFLFCKIRKMFRENMIHKQ